METERRSPDSIKPPPASPYYSSFDSSRPRQVACSMARRTGASHLHEPGHAVRISDGQKGPSMRNSRGKSWRIGAPKPQNDSPKYSPPLSLITLLPSFPLLPIPENPSLTVPSPFIYGLPAPKLPLAICLQVPPPLGNGNKCPNDFCDEFVGTVAENWC
jgi:hypothetical protein